MNIEFETRTYRLYGLTPILGSAPASRELRTRYIIDKAPDEEKREEELNAFRPEDDDKGVTVFYTDSRDRMCLMDYQIRGFLKQAFKSVKTQLKVGNPAAKIDKLVFVEPRFIPLMRNGQPIMEEDDMLERPLRAQTMQGERVTLASSEMINDPWEVTFEVTLIPNSGTKASESVTWKSIETALDYGMFNGLGQWRNGSYGKFRWERVE